MVAGSGTQPPGRVRYERSPRLGIIIWNLRRLGSSGSPGKRRPAALHSTAAEKLVGAPVGSTAGAFALVAVACKPVPFCWTVQLRRSTGTRENRSAVAKRVSLLRPEDHEGHRATWPALSSTRLLPSLRSLDFLVPLAVNWYFLMG